jgi:flagellar basal body-associated protein FliL
MVEATPAPNDEPQAPASKKSTLIVRIGLLVFIVAVVLGECLVAYRFLSGSSGNAAVAAAGEEGTDAKPTGAEPKKEKSGHGEKEPKSAGEKTSEAKEHGSKKSESGEHGKKAATAEHGAESSGRAAPVGDQCELDLGKFTVTAHQMASNSTVRIDFRLFGIVATEYKEELEGLLKANEHRFREQVLVIVRSAQGTDLAEAGLGLIKRQILERTNTLLGKPLVRSVIITDFSHIEQ